jgi:hypothetical protein
MKRVTIVATGLLTLLLVASQTAAAGRPASAQCPPAKSHVMLADAQIVLYSVVEPVGLYHDERTRIHGCAYGREPYLVGTEELCKGVRCGGPQGEVLAGPLVAYEEGGGGEIFNRYFVMVRDLRTGRVVRKLPTGTPTKPPTSPLSAGIGPTTAIVVKPDGAVAWIVETGYPSEYQVHAVDSSGSRTLASGTDIDPSSLALAGSTLYWMQNGQAMSAPLN